MSNFLKPEENIEIRLSGMEQELLVLLCSKIESLLSRGFYDETIFEDVLRGSIYFSENSTRLLVAYFSTTNRNCSVHLLTRISQLPHWNDNQIKMWTDLIRARQVQEKPDEAGYIGFIPSNTVQPTMRDRYQSLKNKISNWRY